jgi:hypothetical protein
MELDMLTLGHYLQITRIVVSLVSVDVVNNLAGFQRSPEHLFSDDAMFMPSVILAITGGRFVESDLAMAFPLFGRHLNRRSRSQLSRGRNFRSFNRRSTDERFSTTLDFLGEIVDRLVHSDNLIRSPFAIALGDVLRHQVSTFATTFY